MLVKNASPRGPMCFRCLMYSLSGPCELLFLPYWDQIYIKYYIGINYIINIILGSIIINIILGSII